MIKICHIITGLNTGGAEMMLYKLLSHMDSSSFKTKVISLTDIGPVGNKIEKLGVPVQALGMKRGFPDSLKVLQLANWLHKERPQVIQTWMYHADLIVGIAAKLAGTIPVVWGIRQSDLHPQRTKRTTIWTAKACAWLSQILPERIVCCSISAQNVHARLGYEANKMLVIPNGFDITDYKPNPLARNSVRQELGLSHDTILIGMVARFDPQKDHQNFIRAAALVHTDFPNVHFLLCGDNVTWENHKLVGWIDEVGIRNYCHLLGRRDDIPRIMAALDIASLSSSGEGFPNVVGEAMACGIPCVVTDVGDSALIVNDTGRVVPPQNSKALANAWIELVQMEPEERNKLGKLARRQIKENFDLKEIAKRYEALYKEVASKKV